MLFFLHACACNAFATCSRGTFVRPIWDTLRDFRLNDEFPGSPGRAVDAQRLVNTRQRRLGTGALANMARAAIRAVHAGRDPLLNQECFAQRLPAVLDAHLLEGFADHMHTLVIACTGPRMSTLHAAPHGTPRMTRGQCDSLFLHRLGLSPFTPCRSPGARLIDETRPWKFPPIEPDDTLKQDLLPKYIGFNEMDKCQQLAFIRQNREANRPPRTWKQWLMPWTYPKLTSEQRWALKRFD